MVWQDFEKKWFEKFNKKPTLETVLLIVGWQETGLATTTLTKQVKQDLLHVGVCSVLIQAGYYILDYYDNEGWPHFIQVKPLPNETLFEQEFLLKQNILIYFEKQLNALQ